MPPVYCSPSLETSRTATPPRKRARTPLAPPRLPRPPSEDLELARGQQPAGRDLHPLPPAGRTFIDGFESTYLPAFGVDGVEESSHDIHRDADVESLLAAGVRHLRYPVRWHRMESEPGLFNWGETDRVLGRLRDAGAVLILDLLHHTSYPDWLRDGFRGPDLGPAFVRFAEAVAQRYPWLPTYTLLNEPLTTFFFTGHRSPGALAAV